MNKVKGTYDVLPNESHAWQFLEKKINEVMKLYHFKQIRTPIMEYSDVFHRETEQSDMVKKETYNFLDRSDRKITLRPEGTAGIVRSYIENKLYVQNDLTKVFYFGPNYRYERPQKGRYREFFQFGVEAIGIKEASLDAEVIKMAYDFIKHLNLEHVKVNINTLGDEQSRQNFKTALITYLQPLKNELSDDSKRRLEENPLRILDSKDVADQALLKNAPKIFDYLSEESKTYFREVLMYLDATETDYEISDKLVRGLDYYSNTVFEIEASIEGFGAQNVLGGGGRYHGLVSELGGPSHEGVGFAFGVERLLHALSVEHKLPAFEEDLDLYIIYFDKKDQARAFKLLHAFRSQQLTASFSYTAKNFKQQLKDALKKEAKFLIILGEDEINKNVVTVKNTKTEEQVTLSFEKAVEMIKKGK